MQNNYFSGNVSGSETTDTIDKNSNSIFSLDDKLKTYFPEMVVFKDLKKINIFSNLGLPSFLRDWLLKQFQNDSGKFDSQQLATFVNKYLPKKEDWLSIKNRITVEHERVQILTKITVDINISTREVTFSLPNYGLTNKETIIEPEVWFEVKDDLVAGNEIWGILELGYRPPIDEPHYKQRGKIKLTNFKSFRPYDVDTNYYKEARKMFSTSEWINILLGAIDYNASGYKDEHEKLAVLTRLLPFIEKRLNLIELAPKGTGKSYMFGHISKFGLLTDGGKVTRAKMFYDTSKRQMGFIAGHDYVAIDEVKLVTFGDINEMRSIMQGYMEYGTFNIGGFNGESDAGIVFLGNIDKDNMNVYTNMFTELPSLFKESALVDRIHGFIKGWDIPRMNDDLKVCGWALNSEYFCTMIHILRSDVSYRAIVDEILDVPYGSDTRDTEAVKRICTAYLKLLFPNVCSVEDVNLREFNRYCLSPAKKMRGIIIKQLGILDPGDFEGKNIPDIKIKKDLQ